MSGKGNKTYYTPKVPMKIIKITRVNDGKIIKVYSPKSKKLLGTVKIPNEGKGYRYPVEIKLYSQNLKISNNSPLGTLSVSLHKNS